jgi:16S rRNA (guanine1516-N2)-methyltransferase
MLFATMKSSLSATPPDPLTVVVETEGTPDVAARELAQRLGLSCQSRAGPGSFRLRTTEHGLELCDPEGARLRVEFSVAELKRYRPGASGRDLLWRALGTSVRTVVDATAGLGRDSVHMACLGYRVTAVERSAVVAALFADGLARARAAKLLAEDSPVLRVGDAREVLPSLDPRPHAIYLDPMFPSKHKQTAAVRKEMRLVRALVADDEDYLELYSVACACATERVVVKRPDDGLPLAPNPSASYRGKTVRYDVYRVGKTG